MILTFDNQFDATDWPLHKIREEARKRGWPGVKLDADEINRTDRVIVRRLSRKDAYSE